VVYCCQRLSWIHHASHFLLHFGWSWLNPPNTYLLASRPSVLQHHELVCWLQRHDCNHYHHSRRLSHLHHRHLQSPTLGLRSWQRTSIFFRPGTRTLPYLLTSVSANIKQVYHGWDIPLNAIFMSFIVTAILSLINLGSTVAIQAVASLSASMLLTSYMVSISTLLLRRYTGPNLPTRRWSLGRWGAVVNIVALCFLSVFWIFSFFPPTAVVTTTTMNWNSLMFAIIVVVALVYYLLKARHEYVGPVMLVKRDS